MHLPKKGNGIRDKSSAHKTKTFVQQKLAPRPHNIRTRLVKYIILPKKLPNESKLGDMMIAMWNL